MTETQDRRELILTRAAELFARKGIAGTTVREIADAVGMLSGSLYHHFESKDAIVDEVLVRYFDEVRAAYSAVSDAGGARQQLHDLVLASLELAVRQRDAIALYQAESQYLREQPRFAHIQKAASELQRRWMDVIDAGVADGTFRSDVDPRLFYRLLRDAVWLTVRWNRSNGRRPTQALAQDITSVFLDGFCGRAAADAPAGGR